MPKFSICSPIWLDKMAKENDRQPRYEMFLRAVSSIVGQTFKDFEWVIADDISKPSVDEIFMDIKEDTGLRFVDTKVIRLPEKSGRIAARNAAMKASSGEWILWFDGDDELSSIALEGLNAAIKTYPEYKVFNWNHLVFGYNYDVNVRKFINMEVQGDAPFGSGNIGAGAFVLHRSVWEDVGPMPELGLWDFTSDFLEKYPECKPFFWNEANKGYNSLGNPWGCDYRFFYEITRKYKSKYLDTAFYYVHSRFGHKWREEPEIKGDMGDKPNWNPNNI